MAQKWGKEAKSQMLPNEHTGDPSAESAGSGGNPNRDGGIVTSDREEYMQCIKRGQRPTWIPKPGLEALCAEADAEAASRGHEFRGDLEYRAKQHQEPLSGPTSPDAGLEEPFRNNPTDPIERPRSALHSGDFADQALTGSNPLQTPPADRQSIDPFSELFHASSSPPWFSASPPPSLGRSVSEFRANDTLEPMSMRRSRAPSLGSSLSSSFVMRIPTSPLVQATSSPSLDLSSHQPVSHAESSLDRSSRRRTMPPNAFNTLGLSPVESSTPNFSRPFVQTQIRRESSLPHQSHQPRRSLSSFTYQPMSSPKALFTPRSRLSSAASDVSPRQRASMVGSFEESILRGRMSTPASKPLDFVAQIGVLGKGDCPASLKCPAHISVPFPAVFYSYPASRGPRTIADDSPSPYVGTIDLENRLKPVEQPAKRLSGQLAHGEPAFDQNSGVTSDNTDAGSTSTGSKRRRHKTAARAPPKGAYRVPQQGQLQIIIKNPNKTAVKLFLIPYDLDGMDPGTKTFVRQRSFSSGPIIENAISENPASLPTQDSLVDKSILRYLIHLRFCSPAKGKFYLYDNIRVVFANRVPDGKERLQNEVQLPDPRYSPYKPATSRSSSIAESTALKRAASDDVPSFDVMDGIGMSVRAHTRMDPFTSDSSSFRRSANIGTSEDAVNGPTLPIRLLDKSSNNRCHGEDNGSASALTQPPIAGFDMSSTSTRASPIPWTGINQSSNARAFSPTPAEAGDGLLSRKLRELRSQAANGAEQAGGGS